MPNQLLTVAEAADVLRYTTRTIYRYIKEGKIPAARIGGQYRISRDDLDALIVGASVND